MIADPYRHRLVVGSTGCGKTTSVVEPYLREALKMRARPGWLKASIRTLNMVDPCRSHRFNLLSTIRTPRAKLKRFTKSFCTRRSI